MLYITKVGVDVKMKKEENKFKYGKPLDSDRMPKPKKRLPQYDECLEEFLKSGYNNWEVDMAALPSSDPRVVLSSLKWRVKNKSEFRNIKIVMFKNKIYLERVRSDE